MSGGVGAKGATAVPTEPAVAAVSIVLEDIRVSVRAGLDEDCECKTLFGTGGGGKGISERGGIGGGRDPAVAPVTKVFAVAGLDAFVAAV